MIVAFLILLAIGHWVLVFAVIMPPIIRSHGNFIVNPDSNTKIDSNNSVPFLLYTFSLDLFIVLMTIVGLLRQRAARSSKLWKSLYRQGIMYFLTTFAVQLPTVIFAWDTESACMIGAFSMPGLVISVMASSYAVMSLLALPHAADPDDIPAVREKPGHDMSLSPRRSPRLSTNINLPTGMDSTVASSNMIRSLPQMRMHGEHDLEATVVFGSSGRRESVVLYNEKNM
ncbi:uncharacterized protein PHACADRAFT_260948 [Phanerochaete carnosa HHB-10118-sp]|uniref:Uncharacterized protein n=1 Tax=Phanerochaete carnosa (strain HHB-10118-sp) TaxID=650164 RepID=K5WQ75_PHACS|nr:uncharacterized protein PHACADRAFT_260948 [Phanerochaete carnosa HHB-10118-sp]EKM52497.1 hypothetical protein PHACADRAFT_260948 [Phanerochaete carnosa HHB-10118-sp]